MPTSRLQKATRRRLRAHLGEYRIEENARPEWLIGDKGHRLEIDFFMPDLCAGIEVQGAQHTQFVPRFHGSYRGFIEQIKRDRLKKKLCHDQGVSLFEVFTLRDVDAIVEEIIADKIECPYPQLLAEAMARLREALIYTYHDKKHNRFRFQSSGKAIAEQGIEMLGQAVETYGYEFCTLLPYDQGVLARIKEIAEFHKIYQAERKEQRARQKLKRLRHHNNARYRGRRLCRWSPNEWHWPSEASVSKRRRAKSKKVQRVDETWWHVWGGENHHAVASFDGKIYCACTGQEQAPDGICTHMLAVRRAMFFESANNCSSHT